MQKKYAAKVSEYNFARMFNLDLCTLIYLIAEQALISEQVLNSKVLPARFLYTAYVVPNM